MSVNITSAQAITVLCILVMALGGWFFKDLHDSIHTLSDAVKTDHEVIADLVFKDKYLNGPSKAAPVAAVKPLSPEIALAAAKK